jgi:hypothetical protein
MRKSLRLLNELIGREGFAQLRVADLCQQGSLLEVVTEKVQSLDAQHLGEQELEREVRLLLELLRETFLRRYNELSVLAFAHILVALDHFVRVKDQKPDTHLGGFEDDLAAVRRVLTDFQGEIEAFQAWKLRMEA